MSTSEHLIRHDWSRDPSHPIKALINSHTHINDSSSLSTHEWTKVTTKEDPNYTIISVSVCIIFFYNGAMTWKCFPHDWFQYNLICIFCIGIAIRYKDNLVAEFFLTWKFLHWQAIYMMSWHGNALDITGPLWGESTITIVSLSKSM